MYGVPTKVRYTGISPLYSSQSSAVVGMVGGGRHDLLKFVKGLSGFLTDMLGERIKRDFKDIARPCLICMQ